MVRKNNVDDVVAWYDVGEFWFENGVDGVLIRDMGQALEKIVKDIESNPEQFNPIRDAAFKRFQDNYSQEAMEQMMTDLIEGRRIKGHS